MNAVEMSPKMHLKLGVLDVREERMSTNYEIEEKLKPLQWKNLGFRRVTQIAAGAVYEELRINPHKAFSFALLGTAFPAIVGCWACLKTFQVTPLSDLESSDPQVSMRAAQNIGNTGMAITYIVQLQEFMVHPITVLFKSRYNKKVCKKIREHYKGILSENKLNKKETEFLAKIENGHLFAYHGLPISSCQQLTEEVESIQEEIDGSLSKKLSTRNVIYLTSSQVKRDVLDSSCGIVIKKILIFVVITGLLGFCNTVLGIGTYGCYKPFDIQDPFELGSSDPEKAENAVANYANAGHGLEYIAVLAILSAKSMRVIVGKQYSKVKKRVIREVYTSRIHNSSYSAQIRNFLHERMCIELRLKTS